MPAPVECRAAVSIQEVAGTYKGSEPPTVLTLNCEACPVGLRNFTVDPRYFNNPRRIATTNAQDFLARGCGLKKGREAVILPRGL